MNLAHWRSAWRQSRNCLPRRRRRDDFAAELLEVRSAPTDLTGLVIGGGLLDAGLASGLAAEDDRSASRGGFAGPDDSDPPRPVIEDDPDFTPPATTEATAAPRVAVPDAASAERPEPASALTPDLLHELLSPNPPARPPRRPPRHPSTCRR